MHYRLLTITVLVVLCLMPFAAHGERDVRVGVYDNPPLSIVNTDGSVSGLNVDILKEIAVKEKWRLSFVTGTLEEGLKHLSDGDIDILASLAYSPERAERFDISTVTIVVNWGQIYAAREGMLQSFLDLDGKRVAVVKGNIQYSGLKELLGDFGVSPRYVEVDSFKKVFELLQKKQVDAGVVGRFFGMLNDERYGVAATPIVFNPIELRYGFHKGVNADLISAIDQDLTAMKADRNSAYHKALEQYLQVAAKGGVPRWVKWLIGIAGGLFAVFFALSGLLRREVRRRTEELQKECEVRLKAEDALAASEQKYRELVESANSIILKLDTNGVITFANDYAEAFFQLDTEEIIGRHIVGTLLPETESSGRDLAEMIATIMTHPERHLVNENECLRKDGSRLWVSWANRPLFDDDGTLIGILSVGQDITDRRLYEQQLVYQANHDILTGLPNRNLLADRLQQAMAMYDRHPCFLGLILLDIDNFKVINDTLGHGAGDLLLIAFADRLHTMLRKSDTLARLSGDEFVILPADLQESQAAAVLAEKVLSAMAAPFRVNDRELYVTVSIGIVGYPADGENIELLLQHAEATMYEAKRDGKNAFRFFTGELNQQMHDRLSLETKLHRALEQEEFLLHYQPQVDLQSNTITGMEALIRWKGSDGVIIPPGDFIPALEESGLIVPVGEWVLETACRQAKQWIDELDKPFIMSVNISARQFQRSEIVTLVAEILQETGLPAECLRLELTESLLMIDSETALDKLHQLKHLGVSLSIDDFGTGYSSLSYLKKLPISELKIDRAFVMNIPSDSSDTVLVNTIISMAQCLNLHVVAEGVENEEQRSFLAQQQCPTYQGFLFSRPLPVEQFTALLKENQPAG